MKLKPLADNVLLKQHAEIRGSGRVHKFPVGEADPGGLTGSRGVQLHVPLASVNLQHQFFAARLVDLLNLSEGQSFF